MRRVMAAAAAAVRRKSTVAAPAQGAADLREAIPLSKAPGPGWWFLVQQAREPVNSFQTVYDQYKHEKLARIRGADGKEAVVLFDNDDILHVMRNESKYPKNTLARLNTLRDYYLDRLGPDSHGGFALEVGEKWREFRDLYGPGLMTQAAGEYVAPINVAAEFAAEQFPDFIDQNVDIQIWAQCAAFDMFHAVMFGYHEGVSAIDAKANHPLFELIELDAESLGLASRMDNTHWILHPRDGKKRVYKAMDRLFEILTPHVNKFFNRPVDELPHSYFRDLVVDKKIPKEQLLSTIPGFLQAGIATTQGLTQWVLLHLANNPDKQAKLRAEIAEVLGNEPFSRDVKLPYMEAVFRECHRLTPVVPMLSTRYLEKDIVLPSGYEIPADTAMYMLTLPRAKDPEFVSDEPEVFKPERYLTKNKACPSQHRFNKEPFGYGARLCLGKRAAELEVRCVLVALMRRYEILATPLNQPYQKEFSPVVIPRPFPKIQVRRVDAAPVAAATAVASGPN